MLKKLAKEVYKIAKDKGFHENDDHDPENYFFASNITRIISEFTNAWELHRRGDEKNINFEIIMFNMIFAWRNKDHKLHPEDAATKLSPIPRYILNLHGEVSELYAAFLDNTLNYPCDKAKDMEEPLTCAEEELADILIRVLDMAEHLGIDMDRAVRVKSAYNAGRSYRHGGKKA